MLTDFPFFSLEQENTPAEGHESTGTALELFQALPPVVQARLHETPFGAFVDTLTSCKADNVLFTVLAERWWDTTNTFHLPCGELTLTPADLTGLTGLRVGGTPIPWDFGVHRSDAALEWYLGEPASYFSPESNGLVSFEPLQR